MIFPPHSHQPRDAVAVHVAVPLVDEAGVGALAATVAAAADLACVEKIEFKPKQFNFALNSKYLHLATPPPTGRKSPPPTSLPWSPVKTCCLLQCGVWGSCRAATRQPAHFLLLHTMMIREQKDAAIGRAKGFFYLNHHRSLKQVEAKKTIHDGGITARHIRQNVTENRRECNFGSRKCNKKFSFFGLAFLP